MTTPAPGTSGDSSVPAAGSSAPAASSQDGPGSSGSSSAAAPEPSGDESSTGAPPPAPPTVPPIGPLGPEPLAALQAVMAAEHAALWAYGLVTAHDPEVAGAVTTAISSHQGVRDVAANLIVQGGGTPVGPMPAYSTPAPVTDPASALALAVVIESDCAAAWRSVIGTSDNNTLRGTALSALTDCALRMVTWKQTAKDAVVTVPFPGAPAANG